MDSSGGLSAFAKGAALGAVGSIPVGSVLFALTSVYNATATFVNPSASRKEKAMTAMFGVLSVLGAYASAVRAGRVQPLTKDQGIAVHSSSAFVEWVKKTFGNRQFKVSPWPGGHGEDVTFARAFQFRWRGFLRWVKRLELKHDTPGEIKKGVAKLADYGGRVFVVKYQLFDDDSIAFRISRYVPFVK